MVVLGDGLMLETELAELEIGLDDEVAMLELGFDGDTELEVARVDGVGLTVLEVVLGPVELAVLETADEDLLLMGHEDPSRFEFPVQGIQSSWPINCA